VGVLVCDRPSDLSGSGDDGHDPCETRQWFHAASAKPPPSLTPSRHGRVFQSVGSSSSLCARTRRLRIFYYNNIIRCRSRACIWVKRFSYFLTSPRVTNTPPLAASTTRCRRTVLDTTSFGRVSRVSRRCGGGASVNTKGRPTWGLVAGLP